MRRGTILIIWIGGLALAVALYLVGTDRFLDACLDLYDNADAAIRNLALLLGAQAYSVIRAAAIALYVVFAVLALLASSQGHRGFWSLIGVTLVDLLLVWRPYYGSAPVSHWFAALALNLVCGIVMTQRLTAPPRTGPVPPYKPGSLS